MRLSVTAAIVLALAAAVAAETRAETLEELTAKGWFGGDADETPFNPANVPQGKRICLFLHGLGVSAQGVSLLSRYHAYWGDLDKKIAATCHAVFLKVDTLRRGWDDPLVVGEYCNAIQELKPKVVVTHSMGGLVVAAGIHQRKPGCDLIRPRDQPVGDGVGWIVSQSPFRGSPAADACGVMCTSPPVSTTPPRNWFTDRFPRATAAFTAMQDAAANSLLNAVRNYCGCPPGTTLPHRAIQTCQTRFQSTTSAGLQLACPSGAGGCVVMSSVAVRYIRSIMCGMTAKSISWFSTPALMPIPAALIDEIVGWGSDDPVQTSRRPFTGKDGFVAFTSCRNDFPESNFHTDFKQAFYAMEGNHGDGTGRSGEAYFGTAKKPISFFVEAAKRIIAAP